jgi:hypothetical protein
MVYRRENLEKIMPKFGSRSRNELIKRVLILETETSLNNIN